MADFIKWFECRENMTLAIAIAGFVLSVYNMLSEKWRNRRALTIKIADVFSMTDRFTGETTEIIKVIAVNRSKEAITLSGLEVICNGKQNRFGEYRPRILRERERNSNGETVKELEWYPQIFPIKIEGLGGANLVFTSSGDLSVIQPNVNCRAKFFSNKGIIRRCFKISGFSSPDLIEQCQSPS